MKRVVGLVRVSTEEQSGEDRAGIPRQRAAIEAIVLRDNLDLIRVDDIIDVSGSNVKASPVFQRLLTEIRTYQIAGVVVSDLDRLFRPDRLSDFDIIDVFRDAGATLYTAGANHDLRSSEGAFFMQILASYAGLDRRKILEKTQGAKEQKRKQGKCPSAKITLPRGVAYDRPSNTWSYTPEVEAVREAFRIIDEEGLSNLSEIGRRVDIAPRTLHNLLRNRTYIGRRVYDQKRGPQKYDSEDGRQADRRKVPRPEEEIIDVRIFEVGAVSDERFERVQALLAKSNAHWRSVRKTAEVNVLSGIAICAHCGGRLYGTSGLRRDGKKQGYYICNRNYYLHKRNGSSCQQPSVRKQDMEETIFSFVSEHLTSPEVVERMVASMEDAAEDRGSNANFQRLLKEVTKKRANLLNAVELGSVDISYVKDRMQELAREQSAIEKTVKTAERRRAAAQAGMRLVEHIARGARFFRKRLDRQEKRRLLQAMFGSVSFDGCSIVDFEMNPMFFADSGSTNSGILDCRDSGVGANEEGRTDDGSHAGRDSWPRST